jgi:hypothetical protein
MLYSVILELKYIFVLKLQPKTTKTKHNFAFKNDILNPPISCVTLVALICVTSIKLAT